MKSLGQEAEVAEIAGRLTHVREDSPRRWGTLTAHAMICHVADALRMALGTRPAARTGGTLERTLVKWAALYVLVPWPRGIRTSPELDPRAGGTPPATFAADVAEVDALLRRVAARPAAEAWPEHPIFGRMTGREWLRWGYLHLDHHLRQFGA